MADLTPEQRELRLRLCAHIRRLFAEHRFTTRRAMAEKIDIDPGHFSSLYNAKTDIGLDVAVQLHRAFGESLNALCDDNPDEQYYPPGTHPGLYFQDEHPVPAAAEPHTPHLSSFPATRPGEAGAQGGGRKR